MYTPYENTMVCILLLYCVVFFSTLLQYTACTVLCYTLHTTALCITPLHCTAIHCTLLCFALLHFFLLCSIPIHCGVVYYSALCYTLLYYTELQSKIERDTGQGKRGNCLHHYHELLQVPPGPSPGLHFKLLYSPIPIFSSFPLPPIFLFILNSINLIDETIYLYLKHFKKGVCNPTPY